MLKLKKLTPYLYLGPCIIMLLVFVYIPIIRNIEYSLFEWSVFSPDKTFVGLKNFIVLFQDTVFYTALKNNFLYAVISVVFQVGGGLIVAAMLEDKLVRRLSPIFRTMYFLPVIISITVIALLFDFFYNPQVGLLNKFLEGIGLENLTRAWLGETGTAIYSVIAVSQWQSIGYIMMLYIVAIQKIPSELYEAAEIDGASKIQQFFSVTVPQVKEMTFVVTLVTVTQAFTVFNEPYILTGGGPGNSSQVLGTYLYQNAFSRDAMGYAAAIATVVLVITLLISLIQIKLFKTGKEE
nr:sugar ABC transporter permease [Alkalihalobacillus sp. BA299]